MTYEEMKAKYVIENTDIIWDMLYDIYVKARLAENHGWEGISGWGKGGYDLGSHPYVVIFFREEGDGYALLEYVEGDTYLYHFPTIEERVAFTDELAFYWWKKSGMPYAEKYTSVAELPEDMRGPYGD